MKSDAPTWAFLSEELLQPFTVVLCRCVPQVGLKQTATIQDIDSKTGCCIKCCCDHVEYLYGSQGSLKPRVTWNTTFLAKMWFCFSQSASKRHKVGISTCYMLKRDAVYGHNSSKYCHEVLLLLLISCTTASWSFIATGRLMVYCLAASQDSGRNCYGVWRCFLIIILKKKEVKIKCHPTKGWLKLHQISSDEGNTIERWRLICSDLLQHNNFPNPIILIVRVTQPETELCCTQVSCRTMTMTEGCVCACKTQSKKYLKPTTFCTNVSWDDQLFCFLNPPSLTWPQNLMQVNVW